MLNSTLLTVLRIVKIVCVWGGGRGLMLVCEKMYISFQIGNRKVYSSNRHEGGGSGGFSTFYPGFRFWSELEEFVFSRERGI